jgi:hypothetical protein
MAVNGTRVWEWIAVYNPTLDKEVQWFLSDGSPNGSLSGDKGAICSDVTNGELYINTDGSTTWELTSGGGSATEEGFIRAFIGKTAAGSELPDYTTNNWITDGDNLEVALGKVDTKLGAAFTPETRTKGGLTPSTESIMTMLGSIDDAIGADAEMVSVNYIAVASSIYANLSALDAQVKANADAITTNVHWREYTIGTTADAGLNAAANDTALSTLLPFSDDDDNKLPIGAFSDGDYLLSKNDAGTDKLFLVYDDSGTLRVTQAGVTALAEGDTFVTKYYLPDPTGGENEAVVTYNGTNLIKIADVDWQIATGINLSSGYAAAAVAAAVAGGDSVETAISKLDKDINDLLTTLGTTRGDVNMGTYTGNIITDNQSAKQNIQQLETAIELGGIVSALTGVTTTPTQLDAVALSGADVVVWKVAAEGVTSSLQRWYGEVHAIHDGVSLIDATIVPVLRLGTPPLDVDIEVDINGGNLRLMVDTDTAGGMDIKAVRVSAFAIN